MPSQEICVDALLCVPHSSSKGSEIGEFSLMFEGWRAARNAFGVASKSLKWPSAAECTSWASHYTMPRQDALRIFRKLNELGLLLPAQAFLATQCRGSTTAIGLPESHLVALHHERVGTDWRFAWKTASTTLRDVEQAATMGLLPRNVTERILNEYEKLLCVYAMEPSINARAVLPLSHAVLCQYPDCSNALIDAYFNAQLIRSCRGFNEMPPELVARFSSSLLRIPKAIKPPRLMTFLFDFAASVSSAVLRYMRTLPAGERDEALGLVCARCTAAAVKHHRDLYLACLEQNKAMDSSRMPWLPLARGLWETQDTVRKLCWNTVHVLSLLKRPNDTIRLVNTYNEIRVFKFDSKMTDSSPLTALPLEPFDERAVARYTRGGNSAMRSVAHVDQSQRVIFRSDAIQVVLLSLSVYVPRQGMHSVGAVALRHKGSDGSRPTLIPARYRYLAIAVSLRALVVKQQWEGMQWMMLSPGVRLFRFRTLHSYMRALHVLEIEEVEGEFEPSFLNLAGLAVLGTPEAPSPLISSGIALFRHHAYHEDTRTVFECSPSGEMADALIRIGYPGLMK